MLKLLLMITSVIIHQNAETLRNIVQQYKHFTLLCTDYQNTVKTSPYYEATSCLKTTKPNPQYTWQPISF